MAEVVVLDASALVDALVGSGPAEAVRRRMRGATLHAPAHLDAEVLSALGRLHRAGALSERQVRDRLVRVAEAPIARAPVAPLLARAWRLRSNLRLVDALYAALADELGGVPLLTTDAGLAGNVASAVLVR